MNINNPAVIKICCIRISVIIQRFGFNSLFRVCKDNISLSNSFSGITIIFSFIRGKMCSVRIGNIYITFRFNEIFFLIQNNFVPLEDTSLRKGFPS